MRLTITSTYSHLRGRMSVDSYRALRDCLSYYRSGYRYTWLYKHGRWDGKDCLLYQDTDHVVFPAGLTHRVLPVLQEFGSVEVVQQLPGAFSAAVPSHLPDGTELYPEQVKALEAALFQQRGLFALATNFGKTECIAALAHALHPRRVLVLVDQRALLNQTVQRLEDRLRERVGRVMGPAIFTRERIVVGSVRTLCRRLEQPKIQDLLAHTAVLIVDEVHTVTPTWFPVLAACPAPFRVGLSGTVKEANQLVEEAFFGPLAMEVMEDELVELGRSARMTILMPTCESVVPRTQNFRQVYDIGIVENEPRNRLIAEAVAWAVAQGWPTLVLFYRHEHGARLYRAIQDVGVEGAELVSGRTPLSAVERAKKSFLAGRLPVLIASTIFNKGIDLPNIRLLANAAAWKSPLATRQKLGRALRRKLEGQNTAVVLDPYDRVPAGLADQPDVGHTLQRHAERRAGTYRRQGFEVREGSLQELLALAGGPAMGLIENHGVAHGA